MSSDDLNECVSALLRKEKQIFKNCLKKVIRYNPTGKEKEKRKRFRKNKNQFAQLQVMYDKDSNWDKSSIKKISKELGLKESQIYKWNWDMRKKNNLIAKNEEYIYWILRNCSSTLVNDIKEEKVLISSFVDHKLLALWILAV